MKKGILAIIAILILLVIGVLIWNANQQAGGSDVPYGDDAAGGDADSDNDGNSDDGASGDDADADAPADEDTTDGSGIDDEPEESAGGANIKVVAPDENQKVSNRGLVIVGEARVFESTVNWRVKDADGTVLDSGYVTADAPDVGKYGWFVAYADFTTDPNTKGTVEVYSLSAMDGSEQNMVRIPVEFVKSKEVNAYLQLLTPDSDDDCSDVRAAEVSIPSHVSKRYAMESALWELLEFAAPSSAIPAGTRVNNLHLSGNTVYVDFSDDIETGGSCRVTAIRAQIEATLKAFDGIENVVISVNGGSPEEALQP